MKIVNCPSCKKQVPWSDAEKYRPFCSKRCQQSDFCGWANEEHVLAGNSVYDDVLSDSLGEDGDY